MAIPESVWLAVVAGSSPLLIGLIKEILNARKTKGDSAIASYQEVEKRNEALSKQLDELWGTMDAQRLSYEKDKREWDEKFNALRDKYESKKEECIRLETRQQLQELHAKERPAYPQDVKEISNGDADVSRSFESSADAIVFTNNKGMIVSLNYRAKVMFGYSEEEVSEKPIDILLPGVGRTDNAVIMREGGFGLFSSVDYPFMQVKALHKNGALFDVQLTLKPFVSRGLKHFAGIFRMPDRSTLQGLPEAPKQEQLT